MALRLILFFVIFGVGQSIFAINLKAEYSNAKLPIGRIESVPFYDGDQTIYVFSGINKNESESEIYRQILRYNIQTDSIEEVFQMPKGFGRCTRVEGITGKDIYCFGTWDEEDNFYTGITKFDPVANTLTPTDSNLPEMTFHFETFKQKNSSIVYFFTPQYPGFDAKLYALDLHENTSSFILDVIDFNGYSSFVIDNIAYVFGYELILGKATQPQVLKIDLTSFETESISSNTPWIRTYFPGVVSDGSSAYMLGSSNPDGMSIEFMMEFQLEERLWTGYYVENFPKELYGDSPPASVYVEKLNRIYFFGGGTYASPSALIWYIDLSTVSSAKVKL